MSKADPIFDVIIAGASFAGLATAHGLRAALGPTYRIAIVDRVAPSAATATEGKPDARAFAIAAATKQMLDVLGVWPSLMDVAQPVQAIDITDSSLEAGLRPILLHYDNHTEANQPATYIVPALALERALTTHIIADPAITRFMPTEIVEHTTTDYHCTLTLSDGSRIAAPLLIGADGRRSATREAAGIKTIGWRYAQTAIVTTIAHSLPHAGRALQHFLPGGPFALLPLRNNRTCVTWSEEENEAKRILALDDEHFLAEVEQRVAGRLGDITLDGPRQSWQLDMHLAQDYIAPRYALIGDAAHGVHPIAGQGVNLAFRDVAALVEVLADTHRLGLDVGSLECLGRYQRWRRFDSAVAAAAFDAINRLFSNDSVLLRAARSAGLGIVDRAPALKRYFVSEGAGLSGDLPRLLKGEAV